MVVCPNASDDDTVLGTQRTEGRLVRRVERHENTPGGLGEQRLERVDTGRRDLVEGNRHPDTEPHGRLRQGLGEPAVGEVVRAVQQSAFSGRDGHVGEACSAVRSS